MKTIPIFCLLLFVFISCNDKKSETPKIETTSTTESIQTEKVSEAQEQPELKEYKNDRFRQVNLEKLEDNKFRVRGQAQVFEATINWNVEDGHYILKEGFTTATMGAPEWGNFDFTLPVKKADENSSLNLILFEESAKDGSHQHELMISLE